MLPYYISWSCHGDVAVMLIYFPHRSPLLVKPFSQVDNTNVFATAHMYIIFSDLFDFLSLSLVLGSCQI